MIVYFLIILFNNHQAIRQTPWFPTYAACHAESERLNGMHYVSDMDAAWCTPMKIPAA